MENIFEYDGKFHVSLDGSTRYLGTEKWALDNIARQLWVEYQEKLVWEEDGMDNFIAYLDKNKATVKGNLLGKKFLVGEKKVPLAEVCQELTRLTFQ